jgi:hypothetical protein
MGLGRRQCAPVSCGRRLLDCQDPSLQPGIAPPRWPDTAALLTAMPWSLAQAGCRLCAGDLPHSAGRLGRVEMPLPAPNGDGQHSGLGRRPEGLAHGARARGQPQVILLVALTGEFDSALAGNVAVNATSKIFFIVQQFHPLLLSAVGFISGIFS